MRIELLQAAKIKNPEKWLEAVQATCNRFEINTDFLGSDCS
jgi:hypothetical protein